MGDTNLYSYIRQDPINKIDPSGLTERDMEAATAWIRANDPDLFRGQDPLVLNESNIGADNDGDAYLGETINQNLIALDYSLLDSGTKECSPERIRGYVNALSHELQHARDLQAGRWWNTTSLNEINGRHNAIMNRAARNASNYYMGSK